MSFFGSNTLGATSTPAKSSTSFSSFSSGSATAFGIHQPTSVPTFGFGTSVAPTSTLGVGGFNTPTATSSASTLGGFSGFGTTTTSAPQTLFGASAQPTSTNTTNSGFGGFTFGSSFGATAPASSGLTGFGGFAGTTTTTSAPSFSGFGGPTSGFSAFGSNAAATGFGKQPVATTTPGFGGFTGTTNFMLGQSQQQPPQITAEEAFAQSIFNVCIYGDERDTIIAKWNYLQAMWGTGKSFYSQNAAPVTITPENFLCRFKAMGYSLLPGKDNKMGLVALNFMKPLIEVKHQQQQIIATINNVIGNKPNLGVMIESSKEFEEKKSQIVIYIVEKSQFVPSESKRIPAIDLANFLNQPNVKAQLATLGIAEALALVLPDEDQLKEYLENTPKGIDPRMWRQAKLDNPDSKKFIPVPMIGFNEIKWRIKCQENETETHNLYLQKVGRDLVELRQRHSATTAKIMEYKRNLAELSHKVLKIIVKQECTRKVGSALTPEEEALRTKLENMQALLSAPTQFKGRLSELLSQMRMQRNQYAFTSGSDYTIDTECEDEMKSFLAMQQRAMEVLTDTVTKDLKAIRIIMDGIPQLVRG